MIANLIDYFYYQPEVLSFLIIWIVSKEKKSKAQVIKTQTLSRVLFNTYFAPFDKLREIIHFTKSILCYNELDSHKDIQ